MLPSLLITTREVIEASLITATILGILVKIKRNDLIPTVWWAVFTSLASSVALLIMASLIGVKLQAIYSGSIESITESFIMILTSIFITWAVFFLHTHFSKYKIGFLKKIKTISTTKYKKALFILVFSAIFREGIEIVLFLSTLYLSSNPVAILKGFVFGLTAGLIASFAFFTATIRVPVWMAFRATSMLLIFFAAGLLARGMGELVNLGVLPEIYTFAIPIVPAYNPTVALFIKSLLGLTKTMSLFPLTAYSAYIVYMTWRIHLKKPVLFK